MPPVAGNSSRPDATAPDRRESGEKSSPSPENSPAPRRGRGRNAVAWRPPAGTWGSGPVPPPRERECRRALPQAPPRPPDLRAAPSSRTSPPPSAAALERLDLAPRHPARPDRRPHRRQPRHRQHPGRPPRRRRTSCKDLGARPFLVPAMGSHGGGTAEGQRQVIESYGITEAVRRRPHPRLDGGRLARQHRRKAIPSTSTGTPPRPTTSASSAASSRTPTSTAPSRAACSR